ncbi:MAG: exodeoxyribonuclease VII small subunit [Proteobacteria bacterium]|nr:exodeoxyribonuclease VII small subunit [Pseudomonadota bacterium]
METNKKTDSFESSLKDLEKIVGELERGESPLETQLKSFEKGIALSRDCLKQLEEVEKRVELLTRDSENKLITTAFTETP